MLHCKVSVEKVKEDVNIVQAQAEVAVSKEISVSRVTHPH